MNADTLTKAISINSEYAIALVVQRLCDKISLKDFENKIIELVNTWQH